MVAISCSSCSPTPTPASLVADAFAKGESLSSGGKDPLSPGTTPNKNSGKTIGDTVQISDAARQKLQQSVQGVSSIDATNLVDVYSKPKSP